MNSAELKQVADHLRMTAVDMVYRGRTDIRDRHCPLQILWQHFSLM